MFGKILRAIFIGESHQDRAMAEPTDFSFVDVEYQDRSGLWIPYSRVPNQSQIILQEMRNAQSQGDRVRAVQNGRIVDII